MAVPKVVVFDLGKVLLDFDYSIAVRKLLPRCSVDARQIQSVIDQSPLLFQFETGRLTTEAFFQHIRAASGFRGDLAQFSDAFSDVFTPIPAMVELHERLRVRGVPTYIFSNTNELAIRHVRKNFPFFARFDGYILSYEHGAMKPEPKLYEVVERQCGQSGPALLYLDDREENVRAGAQRGWQALLHGSPERSLAAVAATGLLA